MWPARADHGHFSLSHFPRDIPPVLGPLKGPVPPRLSAVTKTNPFTLYKTWKLGKWQYFIAAWFLFWWFGMEWRTLMRAWAGVWWALPFALYCGLFHNFSCLTDKYLKAWRALPLPWKKKTPNPKTSPWQREWLRLFYWSIKAETNAQQSTEQGRASLIAGFVREKSGRRVQLQCWAATTVSEEQRSLVLPKQKEGDKITDMDLSFIG